MKKVVFAVVLGAAYGLFALSAAPAARASTVVKEVRKSFPLKPGGELSLENVNGGIRMEGWDENRVEVQATIRVRHSSRRRAEKYLQEVEIFFDHGDDFLHIDVDYPGKSGGGDFWSWLFGHRPPSVSITFELKVPRQLDVDVRTVNGKVDIARLEGDIQVRTTNGAIRVENVAGKVSCRTVNGGISVSLEKVGRFDEMSLKTVNGSIRLAVPRDIRADLEASTVNGHISSDLPIELRGRISRRSLHGKINGGGGFIILKTVNGSISLRESE